MLRVGNRYNRQPLARQPNGPVLFAYCAQTPKAAPTPVPAGVR